MSEETKDTPVVVSREDRLELELVTARMQNIQLQLQIMQQDMIKATESRNTLIKRAQDLRTQFQQKYGIDITKVSIGDDGKVKENPV